METHTHIDITSSIVSLPLSISGEYTLLIINSLLDVAKVRHLNQIFLPSKAQHPQYQQSSVFALL